MKILIRADASETLGSGHVMRCLTLADELRERGTTVHFLCQQLPGHLMELIEGRSFPVHSLAAGLDESADAQASLAVAAELGGVDWLVVDHYDLGRAWETTLRPQTRRVMVIDDTAEREHDCDLLLDQNYHPDGGDRYRRLLPEHCQTLLGPRYALLRPAFARLAQRPPRDGRVRRVLLFFGGADAGNETAIALEAVGQALAGCGLRVDVVVGINNPHRSEIETRCRDMPGVHYHCQVAHMAELMAEADLALGAGGSTHWERCALGLPSLVVTVADNQRATSLALAEAGALLWLGEGGQVTVEHWLRALGLVLTNPLLLRTLSHRARALVDGRGTARVAAALDADALTLRPAGPGDCEALHRWRNHPQTRRHAWNREEIPPQEHRHWFEQALADPDRVILIGEDGERPVGVLRYDLQDDRALISVYLVPGNEGRSYGQQLLRAGSQWLRDHHPQVRRIVAEVRRDNIASTGAFRAAGFEEHRRVLEYELSGGRSPSAAEG